MRKRLTYKYLKDEFFKKGYTLLSAEYRDSGPRHHKISVICSEGHIHNIIYKGVQNYNCITCSRLKQQISNEKIISSINKKNPNVKVIGINRKKGNKKNHIKGSIWITFICECGEIYTKEWHTIKNFIRCKKCSYKLKYSYEFVKKYLENFNYILLSKEYVRADKKILVHCQNKNHKPYYIAFSDFLRNIRCKQCSIENSKGKSSPNWNKNKTDEERIRKRNFPGYGKWKKEILERDNYICQVTGIFGKGEVAAHHLESFAKNKKLRHNVNNGVTIAKWVHDEFHKYFGQITTKKDFKLFCQMWKD